MSMEELMWSQNIINKLMSIILAWQTLRPCIL
uniref:Uncharacterized protein n=1 Tax=Setaria italica TaxID=4555 RepID=K4A3Y0_SETIT